MKRRKVTRKIYHVIKRHKKNLLSKTLLPQYFVYCKVRENSAACKALAREPREIGPLPPFRKPFIKEDLFFVIFY